MAIDFDYLATLSEEDAIKYLKANAPQSVAIADPGPLGTPYYDEAGNAFYGPTPETDTYHRVDSPVGTLSGGWSSIEGGWQKPQEYTRLIDNPNDPTRSYVMSYNPDGSFRGAGLQIPDSWYDKEVLGIPVGAYLPFLAAAAGAALAPAAGAEAGVVGADGFVTATGEQLLGGSLGDLTIPVADTLTTAIPEGLGTGTFGMNATFTTPALAAMESGTLPALTATGEGLLGATLPASAAVTAGGAGVLDGLLTGKNLATLAGAAVGAASSGNTKGGTTSREPWEPAQPYLKGLLADNDAVLQARKATPWTDQYKAGVQNLANRADAFGASMPNLMGFVNQGMNQQPYQPQFMPASMRPATAPASAPATEYFKTPDRVNFGQFNWDAMNPWRSA